jgi:hypothetical protein
VVAQTLKMAIGKAAYTAENLAKAAAPVQYGQLRGSITTQGQIVTSDNVEAKVGTNVKYAPYQESGTGIYAGKGMIRPKRARVLAWQGKGGWMFARAIKGVQGKFFFAGEEKFILHGVTYGPFAAGDGKTVFFGIQNMFDEQYIVQLAPTTTGSPMLVNGGVRVRWSGR